MHVLIGQALPPDRNMRYAGTLLKKLGFSHVSARPRHPGQDVESIAAIKNFPQTLSAHLADLPKEAPVEIWFHDEARTGQKNGFVRQWSRRGSRPHQPAGQRYENAQLFGAICPARGTGAAIAVPYADTEAIQLHLIEISRHIAVMSPRAPTPFYFSTG